MNFCDNCDNMYYIKLNADDSNKLVYYCRNCGNEDTNLGVDSICVSKTYIQKTEQTFNHIINKYTKLDPTLPRINNILCPNSECLTNTKNEPFKMEASEYLTEIDSDTVRYYYSKQ